MPITDRLVLPVDVTLTPVSELSAALRSRLKARPGEYALTRPRGRANARLVSAQGAALLAEFRGAQLVAEAVSSYAARLALDPDRVLTEAFPLLRDCFNDRFLVPASSPDAAAILPTRERGDRVGAFEVLELLQLRDDTELYQARGRDGKLVALKLARPGRVSEAGPLLAREAAALRRLAGAGVPRLAARGTHASRPWLALSWRIGVSARIAFRELRERSALTGRAPLLELAGRIARAYHRLHRRGVLHGDIHPENLLIGRRGEVTLLDFGLAAAIPPLRLGGQAARGAMAPYFTPEHAAALLAGRHPPAPTRASEVHAVGSLLYALVTGAPYADFELDRETMLRQILTEQPFPFSRRGMAPWPALETVLRRALEKRPEDRFPSMGTLVSALRQVPGPPPPSAGAAVPTGLREQLVRRFLTEAREAAPGDLAPPTGSVMLGGAGVAYALYRLACQTDAPEALALADVWLTRVEAASAEPTAFSAPGTGLVPEAVGTVSPYHAMTGVRLVRALVSLALGEPLAAETAIAGFVAASRGPCDSLDATLGRSATLLGCTMLLEALGSSLPASAAELRSLGRATLEEVWRRLGAEQPTGVGIAHGLGGILYATLRWTRAAGQPLPGELAARLARLAAAAEPRGRGVCWPDPESQAVVGWCNGAAGLIHLWTLAHERFRSPEFRALAVACGWSAWEGRAALPTLCCGLAGRAYGLLQLYRHTGAPVWLQRAAALAERAMAAVRDGTYVWERPLSLFKGTPGIALLAADLGRPEHAAMPFFAAEGWPQAVPAAHD